MANRKIYIAILWLLIDGESALYFHVRQSVHIFDGWCQFWVSANRNLLLDKDKTTLTSHQGLYRCFRMTFGLKSTPNTFQHVMDTLLSPVKGQSALVYLDKVFIPSKPVEEHLEHLRTVFVLLSSAGISMELRNSPSSRIAATSCLKKSSLPYLAYRRKRLMRFMDDNNLPMGLKSSIFWVSSTCFDGWYRILHTLPYCWTASWK